MPYKTKLRKITLVHVTLTSQQNYRICKYILDPIFVFKMHELNFVFWNVSTDLTLAYVSRLIELTEYLAKFVGPCYSEHVPYIFQPGHHVVRMNLQVWPEDMGLDNCDLKWGVFISALKFAFTSPYFKVLYYYSF